MKNSGRFETTTKVKIPTPFGVVLKVTIYNIDEEPIEPIIEYRIRPKCAICGENAPCMCFSYDNFDNPEQESIDTLQKELTCEKSHCICETFKKMMPEEYTRLEKEHGGDVLSICEALQEKYYTEADDGLFCEV